MVRYKVIVAYDGTQYHGWQKQINGIGIQTIIEEAIEQITKEACSVVASGRTDGGVHALGQVFHFDSQKNIANWNMKQALNSVLPSDIRIQQVEQVNESFHARFSAVSKRYDYLITNKIDDPFRLRYMEVINRKLDIEEMRKAATILIGTHDFTTFTSAKIDPRKPRVRTLTRLELLEESQGIRIIFEGTGFLRYQVRMMVGTLIEVGKGKLTDTDVKKMLEGKNKHLCRYKASPQGLYLVCVNYEEINHE